MARDTAYYLEFAQGFAYSLEGANCNSLDYFLERKHMRLQVCEGDANLGLTRMYQFLYCKRAASVLNEPQIIYATPCN